MLKNEMRVLELQNATFFTFENRILQTFDYIGKFLTH